MRRVVKTVRPLFGTVLVCDAPAEEETVTRGTIVEGWAFSPAGIKEISIWLDGKRVGEASHGLERPDVAREYPNWPGALRSGFRYCFEAVPASAETAELLIATVDEKGRRTEVRRVVRPLESLPATVLECEEPAEGAIVARGMAVEGWAFSLAGIKEISVWLDGERVEGEEEYGILREDVARNHPEWPNALRSGFRYRLKAVPPTSPTETAELLVVAEDGEGHRAEVRRAVLPVEQVLVCEEPAESAAVTLGTVVEGWALSPAGIKEISVWLDGERIGRAELGLERPDIARAYPEWPDASRSGFRYRFEAVPASVETAELTLVAEDIEGRRSEVRRVIRPVATVLVCDAPAEEETVTRGTIVEGWAFSPAGIKEISIWLDGKRVGEASHGLERPDVAREYPNWPGALRSGFRYCFEAVPASAGTAELLIATVDEKGRRTEARRFVRAVGWTQGLDEAYGRGLRLADRHYRSYVGPPEEYDLLAAAQFTLLLAAGLRETHRMADVGCGSLRAGRLFIPYLRPGHYFGVEPNRWLVEEGIQQELGEDMVRIKRPTFRFVEDFSLGAFGVDFDFAIAHSVFSHTYPDLALTGLRGIAGALAPQGKLFATFMDNFAAGEPSAGGSGWLYPGCVIYAWEEMRSLIEESGLVARRIGWIHPRQSWFVAAHPGAESEIDELSSHL